MQKDSNDRIISLSDRSGRELQVGDLVNYYLHYTDNKVPKLCVVAYDYHGNLSLYFTEMERHIATKESAIEYVGNIKDSFALLGAELIWAAHL